MTVRNLAAVFVLFSLFCSGIYAESNGADTELAWRLVAFPPFGLSLLETQTTDQQQNPAQKIPEPYVKNEFPRWMQDLWRGGVIFVGSLPFTYFFTLEGYDIYRYTASGFVSTSAPWPFRPASDISYSADEQFWLIASTLTASLLVSAADYLIGVLTERQAETP